MIRTICGKAIKTIIQAMHANKKKDALLKMVASAMSGAKALTT
jgi:hypothetical protein